ncbi:hypothetical protein E2320_022687 [Naja naja]|nr:hypothetical protein E2320_022687 [Naja naja]
MAEVNVPTSVLGSTAVKEQIEKLKDSLVVKDDVAASPVSALKPPFVDQKSLITGTPSTPWTLNPRSRLKFGDWLNCKAGMFAASLDCIPACCLFHLEAPQQTTDLVRALTSGSRGWFEATLPSQQQQDAWRFQPGFLRDEWQEIPNHDQESPIEDGSPTSSP